MNGDGGQSPDRMAGVKKRTMLGIGNRLVLWFALFSLVPLGLTVLTGHILLKAAAEDQTEKLMGSLTAAMKQEVELYFEDMAMAFQAFSGRRITRVMMDSVGPAKERTRAPVHSIYGTAEDIRNEFEASVLPQHFKPDSYRDVFIIDARGRVAYSRNGGLVPGTDLFGKEYYGTHLSGALRAAMTTVDLVFSDYEFASQNGENIPVAHMVKAISDGNGETLGLLAIRFDGEGLNQVVAVHADLGQTFDLYLCRADGRL